LNGLISHWRNHDRGLDPADDCSEHLQDPDLLLVHVAMADMGMPEHLIPA
jgi:hypothetical protein